MSQEINDQEIVEKPKRTRRTTGRKKAEAPEAAESAVSTEVPVVAPAEAALSEEKPKRRTARKTTESEADSAEAPKPRRIVRRKKTEAAETAEKTEAPAQAESGETEKKTPRKSVRRTRKPAAEQAELTPAPAETPAPEVKAEAKPEAKKEAKVEAAKPEAKTAIKEAAPEVGQPVKEEAKPKKPAVRRTRKTTARAEAPVTKSALKEAAEANAREAAAEAAEKAAAEAAREAKAEAPVAEKADKPAEKPVEKTEKPVKPAVIAAPRAEAEVEDKEDRQPVFYDDDSVVTNILPPLEDQEQNYGNRNFRSNSFGKSYNDRRRGNKNRRQPRERMDRNMGQPMSYGQDFPPIMTGPMSYDDMPSMTGYGNAMPDGNKRSPRSRKRHTQVNGNTFDPYTQPAFTPPYPGYDPQYEDPDAILPLAQQMLNGKNGNVADDFGNEFEEDGPQPALPGQPSLALPPSEDEVDLEALDEAVNGNRIQQPHQHGRPQDKRIERKNRRDNRHESRAEAARAEVRNEEVEDEENAMPTLPPGTKRVLYVSVVPDEQVEVVITDNGLVTEYFVEMAHQAKIRGNIYKGVINNVDINLQAAFVNFGGGKNGFLQIDEVHPEYWLSHHDATHGSPYPPIQKVLKNGQEVLVQVVKEPAGTKGAFLTTWISLAGRYLVLTPGQEQIGVSRKVEDPEERSRLKELLAGIDPGEDMGVIIRTASEGASKTAIQKDLQYLKRLWKDIRKKGMTEKAPALIYQEADLATRAVRDYLTTDIHEIWVDDVATQASISEMTNLLFPRRNDLVKLHQDPRQTLWERFNLQRQLEEVTSREVVLPSGGRLVFDQTEALMAIDINSGKTQGKSNFESMVFRTNMEAAEAIARHLRLRDIGGQVVIDFIEMRDRSHGREVEKAMRNAMRMDRARHDVGRMSSFGLLELVRQRTGTSAISISTEPCPFCHGTGVRRNMEWQALQALRDIQHKLAKLAAQEEGRKRDKNADKPAHLVYDCDFELGMYLLNKKRDRLCELETKYNGHVEITLKH